MQFTIGFIDILRLGSVGINLIILFYWIRSKLFLRYFLAGRWEGVLESDEQGSDVLDGILIVSAHDGRDNSAFFLYKCSKGNLVKYSGADRLGNHIKSSQTTFPKLWQARFHRFCHECNSNAQLQHADSSPEDEWIETYNWSGEITSIFFQPKIYVSIEGNGVKFKGTLNKY